MSFSICLTASFSVEPVGSRLSLAQYSVPTAKELTTAAHTGEGRKTVREHLDALVEDRELDAAAPLLVMSVRNVLSNHRCGAWVRGRCESFMTVETPAFRADESSTAFREKPASSRRPYYLLCGKDDGSLELEAFVPEPVSLQEYVWAFSGVPVLWNDLSPDELLRSIVAEVHDHSHVWHLPRGNHPEANEESQGIWQAMHQVFLRHLDQPVDELSDRLLGMAEERLLVREQSYLHNILGLREDGRLIQLVGAGKLERPGRGDPAPGGPPGHHGRQRRIHGHEVLPEGGAGPRHPALRRAKPPARRNGLPRPPAARRILLHS